MEIEVVADEVISMMPNLSGVRTTWSLPKKVNIGDDGRKWPLCEGGRGPCEQCGPHVQPRHSMTAYHTEEKRQSYNDPNRSPWLCDGCHEEYYEYMSDLWNEYYASLRF